MSAFLTRSSTCKKCPYQWCLFIFHLTFFVFCCTHVEFIPSPLNITPLSFRVAGCSNGPVMRYQCLGCPSADPWPAVIPSISNTSLVWREWRTECYNEWCTQCSSPFHRIHASTGCPLTINFFTFFNILICHYFILLLFSLNYIIWVLQFKFLFLLGLLFVFFSYCITTIVQCCSFLYIDAVYI